MSNKRKSSAKRSNRNNALIALLAGLGVLVMANVLLQKAFARIDLTDNGVNTLSEASRAAVRALGDFEVKLYISPDLPESMDMGGAEPLDLRGVRTRFRDKLDEYSSFSDGRMRISPVNEDTAERAKKAKLQLFSGKEATVEKGRLKFAEYVVGATFHYKNVLETYPLAIHPEFYEYEITKILTRLKEKAERSVEMKDELAIGKACFELVETCEKAVSQALEKDGDAAEGGLAALLNARKNSAEKVERLTAKREDLAKACEPIAAFVGEAATARGKNEFLDNELDMADQAMQIYAAMAEGLASEDEQLRLRSVQAARAISEVFQEIDKAHDELKNAPGKKSVGVLCGHGAFCPFPASKPIIQPEIAQMLGQKNPFVSQFIEQAKRIEDYIARINEQINRGIFRGRGIEIKQVKAGEAIPADVEALVVFGPTKPIPAADWYHVDQFLLAGKSVVVLVDPFDTAVYHMDDEQQMTDTYARPNASNLAEYLRAYGVALHGDMVLDARSSDRIVVTQLEKQGQFTLQRQKELAYPPFVIARPQDFASGNVLVRNLPSLTLPYATSMSVTPEAKARAEKAGAAPVSYNALIRSSSDSVSQTSGLDVDPARLYQNATTFQSDGPHTLAILASGTLESYFKGRELPEGVDKGAAPKGAKPEAEPGAEPGAGDTASAKEAFVKDARLDQGRGRLLVIGTNFGLESLNAEDVFAGFDLSKLTGQNMDFITDLRRYASTFQNWQIALGQKARFLDGTIAFIENVFDWAIQKDALVAIRTKFYDRRPLIQTSEVQQKVIQYGTIVGVPLLFILFGMLRSRLRRNGIERKVRALLAKGKEA